MLTTEQIEIVRPGDDRYDEARSAWNLAADLNPAAVAYPTTAQDVASIVTYAREHGLGLPATALATTPRRTATCPTPS